MVKKKEQKESYDKKQQKNHQKQLSYILTKFPLTESQRGTMLHTSFAEEAK